MYCIYEKNLATGKTKLFLRVSDKKIAESRVKEMNKDSLFDDKFYYINYKDQEDE